MDTLPKQLVRNLEDLCEHELLQWTVQGSGNIVTVTMKFVQSSHNGVLPEHETYKYKSPAKIRRNHERLHSSKLFNSTAQTITHHEDNINSEVCKTEGETNDTESEPSETDISPHSGITSRVQQLIAKSLSDSHNGNGHTDINTCDPESASEADNNSNSKTDDNENEESTNIAQACHIEPNMYFSKIIADFRTKIPYVTMRGLTWSGNVVWYSEKAPDCKFGILDRETDEESYQESYNLIQMFCDQRFNTGWDEYVQKTVYAYHKYLTENDNG